MKKIKKMKIQSIYFLQIICVTAFLALFSGCISMEPRPNPKHGQTYVTKTNLWYDDNNIINVKNYHHGTMLPVGTEVSVLETGNHTIRFRMNADNSEFTLVRIKKYSLLSLKEIFERYFQEKESFNFGEEQKSFSSLEKGNVKKGILQLGMSKAAAVVAYGYPPSLDTPTIESNLWRYWTDLEEHIKVLFRNDKITSITRVTSTGGETTIDATEMLISIAEFKNLSEISEYEWLSVGIPEFASTFLSRMKGISLVERVELKRFLEERELELSGVTYNSALSKVKSLLGAEYIVLGSYHVRGNNNVNINARMIKTETGEVLRAESVAGEIDRIGELVQSLTLRMSGALGHKLTAEERTRIQQDSINMLKTIKAISQGQLFYEAGKFDKARAVYKEALRENPENAELLERIKDIDIALNAIAVVAFKNDSGKPGYDYLSNAIPEALSTSLIKKTGLPFVERLNLKKALKEMEIGMTGIIDPATAVPVGKLAGATQLIIGSFRTHDTNLTVFTKIIDAEKGLIVANETATGSVNGISELANELADKLVDTLINVRATKEATLSIRRATEQMSTGGPEINMILEESMVGFDFNSATLKPSSYSVLNMLSDALLRYPEYRIVIIGHTDSEGTEEYNEQLSRNRAKSVLQYMKSRGISADRMTSIGYGENRPRDSNDTPEGRAKNRRVEYMLIKQ